MASPHSDPADVGFCDDEARVCSVDHPGRTVSVTLDRLQRLEASEARADLHERHIELLQKQIAETDAILKLELARGEKHAEALMHVARTCDERTSELKEQHAIALHARDAAVTKMESKLVELEALHAAAITKLVAQHKDAVAELKSEIAALKAQAASTLSELVAAVTAAATGVMEILPVRPSDKRQFAEWRVGGIPPLPPPPAVSLLPQFDRAWCAAVCGLRSWQVDVDAAGEDVRATVSRAGSGFLTLRSAAPLRRGLSPRTGTGGGVGQPQPSYRVIIEAYNRNGFCRLGFVPSHHYTHDNGGTATAVAPYTQASIYEYGGWSIDMSASRAGGALDAPYNGWTVMAPGVSAYATTTVVPAVPEGGAVEFVVDYAAGTCRVAFYTPAAVAGGFVEAPHTKMELRFVATASADNHGFGRPVPARVVPTVADSGVALYPALEAYAASGSIWRFAAV